MSQKSWSKPQKALKNKSCCCKKTPICQVFAQSVNLPVEWNSLHDCQLSVKCPASLKFCFQLMLPWWMLEAATASKSTYNILSHISAPLPCLTTPPSLPNPPCSLRKKNWATSGWVYERERERIGRPWKLERILSCSVQEPIVVAISGGETLIFWKYALLHLH